MQTHPRRSLERIFGPRARRRLFAVLFFAALFVCAAMDDMPTHPMSASVLTASDHAGTELGSGAFLRRQTIEPAMQAPIHSPRLQVRGAEIPIGTVSSISAQSASIQRIFLPVLRLCVPVGWHAPPSPAAAGFI